MVGYDPRCRLLNKYMGGSFCPVHNIRHAHEVCLKWKVEATAALGWLVRAWLSGGWFGGWLWVWWVPVLLLSGWGGLWVGRVVGWLFCGGI